MATKNRIVHLMRYLQENSDENSPVTTAQIREELARQGCPVIISTLRTDIEALRAAGYEIQVNEASGLSTTYGWAERKWDTPELQILIDAVCSAQFIPEGKSRELIDKLVSMAGPSRRQALQPRILVSRSIKARNKNMLYTVQAVQDAILSDRQISFQYLQYTLDKIQVPRHQGTPQEDYIVSPYAMVWNNDRYYLVGWSDRRSCVSAWRIDRMRVPKQLARKRVPQPEGFRVEDYADRVFQMYDGPEETVTLRCRHSILDQVIDRFGEDVELRNITDDTFDITVPVCVSSTFYAWITLFVGEMSVVRPGHIRDAYAEYLQDALENVMAQS